jgi:hypothetical protein
LICDVKLSRDKRLGDEVSQQLDQLLGIASIEPEHLSCQFAKGNLLVQQEKINQ